MRGQKTTPTTVAILIYALDIYAGNSAPWIRNKFSNYLILIIQYVPYSFFIHSKSKLYSINSILFLQMYSWHKEV